MTMSHVEADGSSRNAAKPQQTADCGDDDDVAMWHLILTKRRRDLQRLDSAVLQTIVNAMQEATTSSSSPQNGEQPSLSLAPPAGGATWPSTQQHNQPLQRIEWLLQEYQTAITAPTTDSSSSNNTNDVRRRRQCKIALLQLLRQIDFKVYGATSSAPPVMPQSLRNRQTAADDASKTTTSASAAADHDKRRIATTSQASSKKSALGSSNG